MRYRVLIIRGLKLFIAIACVNRICPIVVNSTLQEALILALINATQTVVGQSETRVCLYPSTRLHETGRARRLLGQRFDPS